MIYLYTLFNKRGDNHTKNLQNMHTIILQTIIKIWPVLKKLDAPSNEVEWIFFRCDRKLTQFYKYYILSEV